MTESCPRCSTPRFAAFRYCRTCGSDYEARVEAGPRHPLDTGFVPFDLAERRPASRAHPRGIPVGKAALGLALAGALTGVVAWVAARLIA